MNEHLEIYKVVVDTITANEGRRQRTTTTYLGMLAAITTATAAIPGLPLIVSMLAVFVISVTWVTTLLYFRRLAQAKFAVIAEIEKELALPAFNLEWQHFKDKGKLIRLSLTYLEMMVPASAAAVSFAYILCWIFASSVPYFNDVIAATSRTCP